MNKTVTEEYKLSKVVLALMNGYELDINQSETLMIDQDNRIGICIGDIFYEKTFAELVEILKKLSQENWTDVCAFNTLNKK